MDDELDPHGRTLADTNLFVAIGDPGRPKFERLKRHVVRRDVVIDVPERVQRELSVHPNEIRLQHALDEGWATVVDPPDPTSTSAVAAMDHVRRHIAHETGADEHDVEKADTVFAGLAVEYLCRGTNGSLCSRTMVRRSEPSRAQSTVGTFPGTFAFSDLQTSSAMKVAAFGSSERLRRPQV